MNKKLMLLAAGALTALAFAALPAVASAGTFTADCEKPELVGGVNTCTGTIQSTGNTVLQDDSGGAAGRITCTSTTGTVNMKHGTAEGTTELTFAGCSEGVFGTKCFNVGVQAEGKITTNTLTGELIYLEHDKSVKGLKLTGVSVTFNCPSVFTTKVVTGKVIGEITNPECGVFREHHTADFARKAPGGATDPQKWTQETTTGATTDLAVGGSHATATTTASQLGEGHINWLAATGKVKLTC